MFLKASAFAESFAISCALLPKTAHFRASTRCLDARNRFCRAKNVSQFSGILRLAPFSFSAFILNVEAQHTHGSVFSMNFKIVNKTPYGKFGCFRLCGMRAPKVAKVSQNFN